MIINIVDDATAWTTCGTVVISDINEEMFGFKQTYLTLYCIFGNNRY